jgi:hypothetical protein
MIGSVSMFRAPLAFNRVIRFTVRSCFSKTSALYDRFKSGRLEFDAQVSAVALILVAVAKAVDEEGIAVFEMTKGGLMYEASMEG